ncbi:hypothetical protein [Wolbachia pipientis]|uniref:hypothetical protein n=1 Tax=Wolbachia pipientis TaxID=955 RepID=UPI000B216D22|nr:hypothetical protein [Wolbachia pipientis]
MFKFIYCLLFIIINVSDVYAEVLYVWSQVIPDNKLSIRAITNNDVCPTLYINGEAITMLTRSANNSTEMVCEFIVGQNVRDIHINGMQVPTVPEKISKIAFIGDTGCRVNTFYQQECNSVESWPLKQNLNSVALHQPDLVIHVGDYHYRKKNVDIKKNVVAYMAIMRKCGMQIGLIQQKIFYSSLHFCLFVVIMKVVIMLMKDGLNI